METLDARSATPAAEASTVEESSEFGPCADCEREYKICTMTGPDWLPLEQTCGIPLKDCKLKWGCPLAKTEKPNQDSFCDQCRRDFDKCAIEKPHFIGSSVEGICGKPFKECLVYYKCGGLDGW